AKDGGNWRVDVRQSRQACIVRCCLKIIVDIMLEKWYNITKGNVADVHDFLSVFREVLLCHF
ncbi:MAG: hypothetical protein LUD57_07920, partial [Ruminococcus sp.]|nr:hypothetical protein [Ruminococcus sp.]